jgi:heptosyltransferase-2
MARLLLIDTAYLGDLLLATPLIRTAAQLSAEGTVDLLTSPAGFQAVRNNPHLGQVLVLDKRGVDGSPLGTRRAVRWVRERRPDVALLPRRSLRSRLIARAAGVPRRIGFHRRGDLWLTDAVRHDPLLHQSARNLELLRPLGYVPAPAGQAGPLESFASPQERTEISAWLAQRYLAAPRSFYAVAPGSAWSTKRWPLARFCALVQRLAATDAVVIVGGATERPMAAEILRAAGAAGLTARVHDGTCFSPTANAYLLGHAKALVANDSGALHLGEAAGIPVIACFGPTSPVQGYGPRGPASGILQVAGLPCRPCGRHGARSCPRGHWQCMLGIGTLQVEAAVRRAASAPL